MTAREEYTRDEWVTLLTAPQAAVMAVIFADGGGLLEPVAEAMAAAVRQARGIEEFPDNELIKALSTNRESIEPGDLPQPQEWEETPDRVAARLRGLAIARCQSAMKILGEQSNEREATGYAQWIMAAATAAATARRHKKGFMGVRDQLVDCPEREVLDELAGILGVEVPDLPPADTCVPESSGSGQPEVPVGPIHPE